MGSGSYVTPINSQLGGSRRLQCACVRVPGPWLPAPAIHVWPPAPALSGGSAPYPGNRPGVVEYLFKARSLKLRPEEGVGPTPLLLGGGVGPLLNCCCQPLDRLSSLGHPAGAGKGLSELGWAPLLSLERARSPLFVWGGLHCL